MTQESSHSLLKNIAHRNLKSGLSLDSYHPLELLRYETVKQSRNQFRNHFIKIVFSIFIFTLFSLEATEVFLEGKAAYFRPTSKDFKSIYGQGGGLYGAELSCQGWKDLYVWLSGEYYSTTGNSCLGYSTKVYLIPFGAGLKYLKQFKMDDLRSIGMYGGAGALGTYLHTIDSSPFALTTIPRWGFGAILKTGILFIIKPIFFDVFTNYSFQNFQGNTSSDPVLYANDVNINGWSFGGAFGRKF